MNKNLRERKPTNYYEPEEPAPDEYVYCDKCADLVFEYCSIHGPLLVIPDDLVPPKNSFPSFVPRAALTIPNVFLHIAPSIIPGAGLGVFTTLTLPRGVRFGPYRGQRMKDSNSVYCWQIYDGNNKRSHVVDAVDCNKSNWMRYVNCSRHCREQNLVAYQYQGQLYYRTIKIIPRYTELLIFYGSEFANILNIDLYLYNSNEQDFTIDEILEEKTTTVESEKHENHNFVSDIVDDFPYIDEESTVEEALYEKSNDTINDDRKSPVNITFDCDNQSFKVEFQKTLQEQDQEQKNGDDKQFQCNQCDYKTNRRHSLKRHSLARHSEIRNTIECNLCSYKTHMIENFNKHSRRHKILKIYKCQRCKYDFTTKYLFDEHKNKCRTSKYKCSICSYETSLPSRLKLHMQRHTKEFIFKCDQCQYFGHVKKDLQKHKRYAHN